MRRCFSRSLCHTLAACIITERSVKVLEQKLSSLCDEICHPAFSAEMISTPGNLANGSAFSAVHDSREVSF
jgi:hypothetical protein